jgi:glycosyltransferase involved in cell wall biosynthesis
VVSVGALKPVKGHDVLIRTFAQITDDHPDATLQIIGDGPELSSYQRLVENLGLTSKVDFSGWIDHEGVRSALQQASVFVFPSRHEGFGIALVEAMATGCPIVASEVGGIPEVVHGTNAILIPPEDSEALAEAIDVALRDDSWRETARALGMERALQFTWTSSIDRYESVLEA